MNRSPKLLAAMAVAVALIAAGCGDDDSSSSDGGATGATGASGAPLTEQEFLSQGNDICAAGSKELDQAARQTFSGEPTQAEVEQFATDELVPSVQQQIDDIRALNPPADIADVNQFLDDAEAILADVQSNPASIQADPFRTISGDARKIGLSECAN